MRVVGLLIQMLSRNLVKDQGSESGGKHIYPLLLMAINLVRSVRRKLIGRGKYCGRGGTATGNQTFDTDIVEGREEVGQSWDARL